MIYNCKEKPKKNNSCISGDVYQDYPSKGPLKANMNRSLDHIRDELSDNDALIYSYVLTTVDLENGKFKQGGCAPNFQGGVITLSTCKHHMRTYSNIRKKDNLWIAGFTSRTLFDGKNHYLYYLMKVQERFKSHKEMWDSLDEKVRKEKSAYENRLGDIYEPDGGGEFSEDGYKDPVKNHKHNDCWKKDIDYESGKSRKRPVLLLGNPDLSYLWSKPKVRYTDGGHARHCEKWKGFRSLIASLKTNR